MLQSRALRVVKDRRDWIVEQEARVMQSGLNRSTFAWFLSVNTAPRVDGVSPNAGYACCRFLNKARRLSPLWDEK
jgi:hypothetical protein